MSQPVSPLTTRAGFQFHVRSVEDDDAAALSQFLADMTPEDLRFRFLSSAEPVSPVQLAYLAHVHHDQTENYLAFDPVVGCILASAMLAIDAERQNAEVAIIVRSEFKDRGLGSRLLDHLSSRAAALGVGTLRAVESRDNDLAVVVDREHGFLARACPDEPSLVILEKSLQPPLLEGPPHDA
jgi:acetyltransferase